MAGSPVRDAALSYARRGWSVIPIRPREKVPLLRWETYQTRRATEAEIERWFKRWGDANVGIVTGAISNLAVLDIDPKHDGAQSLRALEECHGALEPTVEAETGGGGRHFYFAYPPQGLRNRAALAPGIDLRAEGGMVVAPPSIHPSGKPYRWAKGRAPDALPPAPMPVWLLRLASGGEGGRGHSAAYWRALVRSGVEEGARNSTIASLAGHLLWHGVDPAVAAELLLCWNRVLCRPPLEDEEVERTVASIARLHAARGERS
ncbi:MAG TPA: bifunctional DNA primase/polymerase [Stellaceae bacterium]|nr:bifunctional DNA primase/polymerase [Stellaceae bacterium]